MPNLNINGNELYYEVHGTGAGILGIHGTPSSALLWVDAAGELANRGRCIIYDRRGFFRSAPSKASLAINLSDHVEDAVALLDTLSAAPAVVIGRSTGGQIALDLAYRFPDKVKALVLLEPALFTVDREATAWARRLRLRTLQAAADNPASASEVVVQDVLGEPAWDSFPEAVREMFAAASPAVLAEIKGKGLDLSADPLHLSPQQLAEIGHPVLILSSEDSPKIFRRVNDRLAEALPDAERVLVAGGHVINPAHPSVLTFVDNILASRHGAP